MSYWLGHFTPTTWNEFIKAGSKVAGFPQRTERILKKVQKGDIFLCYVIGIKRWVGALTVIGPSNNEKHIWKDNIYPLRLNVNPIIVLNLECGIPLDELEGKVSFFAGPEDRRLYKGFLRNSPNQFNHDKDGHFIYNLLAKAEKKP